MPESKQKSKPKAKTEERSSSEAKDIKDEELAASTDELIDEIDAVLEDAELAVNYRQQCGE
jgi:hypothetical protein